MPDRQGKLMVSLPEPNVAQRWSTWCEANRTELYLVDWHAKAMPEPEFGSATGASRRTALGRASESDALDGSAAPVPGLSRLLADSKTPRGRSSKLLSDRPSSLSLIAKLSASDLRFGCSRAMKQESRRP